MSTNFRPPTPYKPSVSETFRDLPASSLGLLTMFLALDPAYHGTAAFALQNEEEDDDSVHPRESRKCKSKLKQWAKSHRERMMKFKQDVETPKTDDYSSKEDVKATELPTNSQEPDSSSTASASLGAMADTHTTISPQSISPIPSTLSKQSPTPITEYQIPPLPSTLSKQLSTPITEYHPAAANVMKQSNRQEESTFLRPLRTS